MTKEELEKEVEEWLSKNWTPYDFYDTECNVYNDDIKDDLIEAYLAGAEPREKRIEELEMTVGTLRTFSNEQAICIKRLEEQIEKMKWHKMDYNDKESYKKIPRHIQLLTEYDCGLFIAYCVNRWTGNHWEEHSYGITRWKEIK